VPGQDTWLASKIELANKLNSQLPSLSGQNAAGVNGRSTTGTKTSLQQGFASSLEPFAATALSQQSVGISVSPQQDGNETALAPLSDSERSSELAQLGEISSSPLSQAGVIGYAPYVNQASSSARIELQNPAEGNSKVGFKETEKSASNGNHFKPAVVVQSGAAASGPERTSDELKSILLKQDAASANAVGHAKLAAAKASEQDRDDSKDLQRSTVPLRAVASHSIAKPSPGSATGFATSLMATGQKNHDPKQIDEAPIQFKQYGKLEPVETESSDTALFAMLIGFLVALAVSLAAYRVGKRRSKSIVQLTVPNSGEHFSIRSDQGRFVLDIVDVRGNLIRTAGLVRPLSVARASVLPAMSPG
jgi:hypothetical protein